MIAVDESNFQVIAYSENARELLGLMPQSVPILEKPEILTIGTDVRTLFTPSSSGLLERAFGAREITRLNPLWVHSKNSGKPFYAVLHRIDVGVVIDLEPARTEDPAFTTAGTVQSQKLAVRTISYLQSLPGGDIKLVCNAVVERVRELTFYDRVMVYKFHEDEHGEVVAESKRLDLEPYIGLHYPSTDIPQASMFLFKQNRVRMIADCHAAPIRLASQLSEKRVLKTQTLLCDMLLRDSVTGIVTQSPSIMDLVKCDGSALYHQGRYYPLGVTPTEAHIKDIVQWLLTFHGDSMGLSTDSLADASYPEAATLGDAVCGMAVAYITSRDFLFWFRSHTAKEVKWGGAKHHPQNKDDGFNMHPRSSFKAFLEVVESRSLPWENAEMDAIHSLQLILRDSFRDGDGDNSKAVVELHQLDELSFVAREMIRLIETAMAPIFAVGSDGLINGWNVNVAELTGLSIEEAMGKSLTREVVHKDSEEIADKLLFML
ncbi:hypothetical protein OROHE_016744 [Orobanche hederae]